MGSTDFLFARPSFFSGFARVLDIPAVFEHLSYDQSLTPAEADSRAIANDWQVVGQDLKKAIKELRAELAEVA